MVCAGSISQGNGQSWHSTGVILCFARACFVNVVAKYSVGLLKSELNYLAWNLLFWVNFLCLELSLSFYGTVVRTLFDFLYWAGVRNLLVLADCCFLLGFSFVIMIFSVILCELQSSCNKNRCYDLKL